MSQQKPVFKRQTNPETGEVSIVKVNKDEVSNKNTVTAAPKNFKEMEQQLESNVAKEQETQVNQSPQDTIVPATLDNQDAAIVLNPTPVRRQDSPMKKEIDAMMGEISRARFKVMTDAFKEDIILLEFVKGTKVEQNRISYIPMTMGMGKKVNKIGKQVRLFQEDLKGLGKDKKALDVDGLRKKYPEIVDDDMDQEDVLDSVMQNEMIMNYIIKKKCQIYWAINDIDPYPLSDLLVMIGLYESRNGFAPSSTE